ncbi:MAG: hypothetical protein HC837_13530 [Chloroflexaceae bacterium]|nr:hypothetical protein [Chloroflexaceae bacterium]
MSKTIAAPLSRRWLDRSGTPARLLLGLGMLAYSSIATVYEINVWLTLAAPGARLFGLPLGLTIGCLVSFWLSYGQWLLNGHNKAGYLLLLLPDVSLTFVFTWRLFAGVAMSDDFRVWLFAINLTWALIVARFAEVMLFGKRGRDNDY